MTAGYAEVNYVDFAIAGDEDHDREGVMEVTSYELFNGTLPADGGVYDARMGTTDHHYKCLTCGHQRKECPGHSGKAIMRTPVVGPLWVPDIRRWLRLFCSCGSPMIDLKKYSGIPRIARLTEAAKVQTEGKRCPHCDKTHPKIVKDPEDYFSYWAEHTHATTGSQRVQRLYPKDIRTFFERITDESVIALGRSPESHPRKMVLTKIPILSITARPGVRIGVGSGPQSYHDINNVLQYLIKRNQNLPEISNASTTPPILQKDVDRAIQNVQQLYYDFILGSASTSNSQGTNGKRGIMIGSQATPSLMRRLPRKEGRLRKNLLGCQTLSISRSTISGNTDLRINEVGFPAAFAKILQIAENIQEYNIDRLMTFFLNGRRQYPGSSRVLKRSTGALHDVEGLRGDFRLEVGDIIYRDIVTGDVAFFNRQPSLERSSIGVHRVVVLEDPRISTFQMNVIATPWYNADFDGDQMNLFIPWSYKSRVEAEVLCAVSNWFISSNSKPVVGQIQDSVIGSFLMTKANTAGEINDMDKYHAMGLFETTRMPPPSFAQYSESDAFTGRQLISMILEQVPVNYSRRPKWYSDVYLPYIKYCQSDVDTQIRRGKLITGVLDKKSVGGGSEGGVFHLISRVHGAQAALDSMFAMQQMSIAYIANAGFTVGTNDMVLHPRAQEETHRIISELLSESEEINQRLLRREIVPPIGLSTHQFYERLQLNALKIPDKILNPILSAIDPETNGLFRMIATGSKGSNPNMIHIMAAVGQIDINTERIRPQFSFGRTLVYFPRFALSAQAYGFVANSYIAGLTSSEFVFAIMNGRFDLISKALSTASTGYANRKAIFALQSCIVDYFRHTSVDGRIIQFIQGEDGLDARRVENVEFRTVIISDKELRERYYLDVKNMLVDPANKKSRGPKAAPLPEYYYKLFDQEFEQIKEDRDRFRKVFMDFESTNFNHPFNNFLHMPVNVASVINDVIVEASDRGDVHSPPDIHELVKMREGVDKFCHDLPYVLINEIQRRRQTPIPEYLKAAACSLQILIRSELNSRKLLELTGGQLEIILLNIQLQYAQSLIDYGEAVGVLAAQSISAPLTQYMLDSHHRSVQGGTNKSGIIRPQEIFGVKDPASEHSSEMLLRLKDKDVEKNVARVREIANSIELMDLKRFVLHWGLLFEPFVGTKSKESITVTLKNKMYPGHAHDSEWFEAFLEMHPLIPIPSDLTKWCVRFELHKTVMILKSMSLERIVERLRLRHPHTYVVHSPENWPNVVVRIYLRSGFFRRTSTRNTGDEEKLAQSSIGRFLETPIRGIPGIQTASAYKIIRHRISHEPGSCGKIEREDGLYGIRTIGSNIYGALTNTAIDPYSIVSSSIGETYKLFGIEAARQKIISEIRRVMGDSSPDHRHLLMYADLMTRSGRVTSLEKKGVNAREHSNVLLRMAMAAPIQVIVDAALETAHSPVYGIAAPMLLGSVPRIGTLYSEIILDEGFIAENTTSVDSILDSL